MEEEITGGDVIAEETTGDVITEQAEVNEADSSTVAQPDVTEVDEQGVPFKNRYFEIQRKYENLEKNIPQLIKDAVGEAVKPQEQKYTSKDYERAMQMYPEHADYFREQLRNAEREELLSSIDRRLEEREQKQQAQIRRQQADQWAFSNFPQLQNPNDPLTQTAWQMFSSRPENMRAPEDFAIAVELAAARLGVKPTTPVAGLEKKVQQQNRILKKVNKERLLEGDGKAGDVGSASERAADFNSGANKGDFTDYFLKYYTS